MKYQPTIEDWNILLEKAFYEKTKHIGHVDNDNHLNNQTLEENHWREETNYKTNCNQLFL